MGDRVSTAGADSLADAPALKRLVLRRRSLAAKVGKEREADTFTSLWSLCSFAAGNRAQCVISSAKSVFFMHGPESEPDREGHRFRGVFRPRRCFLPWCPADRTGSRFSHAAQRQGDRIEARAAGGPARQRVCFCTAKPQSSVQHSDVTEGRTWPLSSSGLATRWTSG